GKENSTSPALLVPATVDLERPELHGVRAWRHISVPPPSAVDHHLRSGFVGPLKYLLHQPETEFLDDLDGPLLELHAVELVRARICQVRQKFFGPPRDLQHEVVEGL